MFPAIYCDITHNRPLNIDILQSRNKKLHKFNKFIGITLSTTKYTDEFNENDEIYAKKINKSSD